MVRRLQQQVARTGQGRHATCADPGQQVRGQMHIGTFDQNDYGSSIEASWRARQNLRLGVNASLVHIDYLNLDREDETRRYGGNIRYDWAKRWSGTFSFARYERHSTAPGQNADQNVFGLTISYRNR